MIKTKENRAGQRAREPRDNANITQSEDRVKFLKRTTVFSTFNRKHLEEIAWAMDEITAEDGEMLCHAGDAGDEIFIVHIGRVDVVIDKDGKPTVVYTAGPGEVLGEMSVLGHIPRTAALRTSGIARLFVLKGPRFIQLLRENPDMSLAVIEMLVRRLAA